MGRQAFGLDVVVDTMLGGGAGRLLQLGLENVWELFDQLMVTSVGGLETGNLADLCDWAPA